MSPPLRSSDALLYVSKASFSFRWAAPNIVEDTILLLYLAAPSQHVRAAEPLTGFKGSRVAAGGEKRD